MTEMYRESEKLLNVYASVDVLVAGGGPAGVSAAVGAAQTGAKTLIVENLSSFGGMWTNGLVITLAGFNNWLKPYQRCVGGVGGEWIQRAALLGGAEDNRNWALNSDPEIMKLVADQLLLEKGVLCLLHAKMTDAILEGNTIRGVIVENARGREVIFAKTVVDCTGNGDVFARAGAKFGIGNNLQPMTMPFLMNDVVPPRDNPHDGDMVLPIGPEPGMLVDPILTEYASRRHDIAMDQQKLIDANMKGILPNFGGPWFGGMKKNFVWVNTTRVYGSAVDPDDLTRVEMQARSEAHQIMNFYKKEMKGFEKAYIAQTSPTIGIRETRRLVGEYILTGDDIRANKRFPDPIATGAWPIDVHPPKGQSGIHGMYVPGPYQIPLRSLIPLDIEQLIVGGRCISLDREALGSARVGATCCATGHAAGVAAAISAIKSTLIRNLDYQEIRNELLRQAAILL